MGRESFQAPARGDQTVRDLSDSASLGLRSRSSRLPATPSGSRVSEGPKVGMRRRGPRGVRRSHEGGAPATRSLTSCRRPQGAPLPSATGDTVRDTVRRGGPSPGSRSAGARSWGLCRLQAAGLQSSAAAAGADEDGTRCSLCEPAAPWAAEGPLWAWALSHV